MISRQALYHLDIDKNRKEQIEMYFDIAGMLEMFQSFGGPGSGSSPVTESSVNNQVEKVIQEQAGSLIESLLPSEAEVAKILKDNGFKVTDENEVVIDLTSVIRENVNLNDLNLTLPNVDLGGILPPGFDLSFLDNFVNLDSLIQGGGGGLPIGGGGGLPSGGGNSQSGNQNT